MTQRDVTFGDATFVDVLYNLRQFATYFLRRTVAGRRVTLV